mmetsp:Transcript_13889/g.19282  ORF Transcript_13889/g.19282 Transcript_13889/m.19282 type:complete len:114 (-) Transcript_13889:370-711(-)
MPTFGDTAASCSSFMLLDGNSLASPVELLSVAPSPCCFWGKGNWVKLGVKSIQDPSCMREETRRERFVYVGPALGGLGTKRHLLPLLPRGQDLAEDSEKESIVSRYGSFDLRL